MSGAVEAIAFVAVVALMLFVIFGSMLACCGLARLAWHLWRNR